MQYFNFCMLYLISGATQNYNAPSKVAHNEVVNQHFANFLVDVVTIDHACSWMHSRAILQTITHVRSLFLTWPQVGRVWKVRETRFTISREKHVQTFSIRFEFQERAINLSGIKRKIVGLLKGRHL